MIDLSSEQAKIPTLKNHHTHPLYEAAQLEQKPVAALRSAFNHWIRSLLMEERFLALKIYSSPIPQILRKALIKIQSDSNERCFEMHTNKHEPTVKGQISGEVKKTFRKIQKGFYDSLVLVSDGHDYFDHICFEFGLLQCPDKLFDLLASPVDNPSARLMLEAMKNRKNPEAAAENLVQCCSLEEVAVETLNFLRQQILLRFRESMLDPQFISRSLEQQKRRKKQFSSHFKHLNEDLKKKMVLLGSKDIEELKHMFMCQQTKIDFEQLQKESEELLRLQKNQFCNRIFKCKLKKAISQIVNYHQQIYIYWKKQVSRTRKRKFSKKFSGQKIEKDLVNISKNQEKQIRKCQSKQLHRRRHKKSVSVQSNQTNVTEQGQIVYKSYDPQIISALQQEDALLRQEKVQRRQQKYRQRQRQCSEESKQIGNISISQKKKQINKKKAKFQKVEQQILFQTKYLSKLPTKIQGTTQFQKSLLDRGYDYNKNDFLSYQVSRPTSLLDNRVKQLNLLKLSQQLQQIADKISQEANIFHDRRIIAFQRIQILLSYYRVQIQLFGSCASGIAIKNSDIDIAIKSQILTYFQYLPENLRLLGALQNLQQIFANQPFITHINMISTASIPVIKLKIDTSKPFLDPTYGEIYLSLNRPHNSGIIEADITIETINYLSQSNHLGIISTQAINQWLAQISTLHCIVIIMKQFFEKKGFNVTYKGGLNTFSMIVLIVSYIYHAKLQKQNNPALVLQQFLKFYGYQFNQKQRGIDLLDNQSNIFYYKKQNQQQTSKNDGRQKADLQILDPKCKRKNITRKCYLFPYIRNFFREMLQECFENPLKQLKQAIEIQNLLQKNLHIQQQALKVFQKRNVFESLLKNMINES